MPESPGDKALEKKPESTKAGIGVGTAVVAGAAAGVLSAAVVGLLSKHGQSATVVSQRLMELLRQIKEYHDWGIFTPSEYNQMRSIILSKMVSGDGHPARGPQVVRRATDSGGVDAASVSGRDTDDDIMEAVDVDGTDADDDEIMDATELGDDVADEDATVAADLEDENDDDEIMDAADPQGDVEDDQIVDASDADEDEIKGDEESDESVDKGMDEGEMDDEMSDESSCEDDARLFDTSNGTDDSYDSDADDA